MNRVVKIVLSLSFNIVYCFFLFWLTIITLILSPFRGIREKSVLYFSLVEWRWIKQRPHFISLKLAEYGYDVTYLYLKNSSINNEVVKNPKKNKKLRIKELLYYPNKSWMTKFVYLFNSVFDNYSKLVITHPNQLYYVPIIIYKIKGVKIIYECMDNYECWEQNINRFTKYEDKIIKNAYCIITSSNELMNRLIKKYRISKNKINVVRNGYDKEVFNNYRKSHIRLQHPNATYIGTIDDWIDIDSIVYAASRNVDLFIYLIGPISKKIDNRIKNIKNIVHIKPIEHHNIPDLINQSDVTLLPFIVNDLIKCVDPVKVYEYLFFDKKVVSSYWNELEQFKDYVYFYTTKEDFNDIISSGKNKNNRKKVVNFINSTSWDERIKLYINIIK